MTFLSASLGVHHEVALLQELLYNAHRRLQIATAVVLKIEDEIAHTSLLQRVDSGHKFAVGGGTERADAHVAHTRTYHVVGIKRVYGYLGTRNGELQQVGHATTLHAELHLRATRSAQTTHDVRTIHLNACYRSVVDGDDAVAGEYAHLLRRTLAHGLYDEQRVRNHIELHADTVERALQWFGQRLCLLGSGVRRVGVELLEHTTYGILHEFLLVDRVDIEVADSQFGYL